MIVVCSFQYSVVESKLLSQELTVNSLYYRLNNSVSSGAKMNLAFQILNRVCFMMVHCLSKRLLKKFVEGVVCGECRFCVYNKMFFHKCPLNFYYIQYFKSMNLLCALASGIRLEPSI